MRVMTRLLRIDRDGNLVDARLSETRVLDAARRFFRHAVATVGHGPARVTTDGHDAYPRAIREAFSSQAMCAAIRSRTAAAAMCSRFCSAVNISTSWRRRASTAANLCASCPRSMLPAHLHAGVTDDMSKRATRSFRPDRPRRPRGQCSTGGSELCRKRVLSAQCRYCALTGRMAPRRAPVLGGGFDAPPPNRYTVLLASTFGAW